MIECKQFTGGVASIPREKLRFRPAVYAFIMHEGRLLLLRVPVTQKYTLPGGGVEPGERLEEALRREVREESGLEIATMRLVQVNEDFFYYDPGDRAYHSYYFIYECQPLTFELIADADVDDDTAEKPRWVVADGLSAADFQHSGDVIMDLLHGHSGAASPTAADRTSEKRLNP
ncbi:MAG: NUDIX domain-containing protein [Anaerolineae bacterium]|nr:NUDIX domain-containing protein [Anaerolineae bacterium]